MRRHYFRAALYLSILIAFTTATTWGIIAFQNPTVVSRSVQVIAVSFVLPFGLWVGSNFIRYVGAALLVLWAGGLLWPLFAGGIDPDRLFLQLVFVLSACLCLCTAWLLLLSRKFRTEFAEEQKFQPRYKSYLRRGLLYTAVAAIFAATLNDIYHLTQP